MPQVFVLNEAGGSAINELGGPCRTCEFQGNATHG